MGEIWGSRSKGSRSEENVFADRRRARWGCGHPPFYYGSDARPGGSAVHRLDDAYIREQAVRAKVAAARGLCRARVVRALPHNRATVLKRGATILRGQS